MNKQALQSREKQPYRWLYAVKGLFRGISTVIRPRQSFVFWHKKVKPDGSSTETIIRYDID